MTNKKVLTDLVEFTVACARSGRATASLGGLLTSAEQERVIEIYSRLQAEEKVKENSPVTTQIYSKAGRKSKIPITEAVDWFINKYPKESLPLQQKMLEPKPPKTKQMFGYGVKDGCDLPEEYYINIITEITNIPREQAAIFYYGLLKPQLKILDETKSLFEMEIK